MKRILSLALSLVLAICMVLPLLTAVQAESVLGNKETFDKLKAYSYTTSVFDSPEAKLETMTKVIENERYSLHIQEYSAEVCVVDKVTGQIRRCRYRRFQCS